MLRVLKGFLDHKWTNNILMALSLLVTIAAAVIAWLSLTTGATGPNTDTGVHGARSDIYWLIIIGVLVLSNVVIFISSRVRENNSRARENKIIRGQELIGKLSALQGSYILRPQYVSATQHGGHSKEGDLSERGTADILTNSLKYDMFYSDAIATNIIRGAKYIYILPNTNSTSHDLQNYIATIHNSIHANLVSQKIENVVPKLEELCKMNLEFWSFNDENPCLYNFAIFRQLAKGTSQPFEQYWWYINPSDTEPNSHMLAYEITEPRDKKDLEEIFGNLKKSTSRKSGLDVYIHRDELSNWFGGKEQ